MMKTIFWIGLVLSLPGLASVKAQEALFQIGNLGNTRVLSGLEMGGFSGRTGNSVRTSPSAEVLKFLMLNRPEEAVEVAREHLESLSTAFLAVEASERARFEQELDFPQFLQVYGLVEAILQEEAFTDRGEEGGRVRAVLADMLGRVEEAKHGYAEWLDQREEDLAVRTRLALLAAENGEAAYGAELLRQAQSGMMPDLGALLANRIQMIDQEQYDQRLDYLELLVAYFEGMDPEVYLPAEWLHALFDQSLGPAHYGQRFRFTDLYALQVHSVGYENLEQEARSRQVEGRRRELHDRLCQALLALPQFSEVGFLRLSGLVLRDGDGVSAFADLAEKLLVQPQAVPQPPVEGPLRLQAGAIPHRPQWVPFLTPLEFLVQVAAENDDDQRLKERVIPALEQLGQSGKARFAQEMMALTSLQGESFISQGAELLGAKFPGVRPRSLMSRLVEMHEAQAEPADLGPLVMAYFKATRFERFEGAAFVQRYGETKAQEGEDRFRDFIDAVGVALLGPEDQQEAFVDKHYRPNIYVAQAPSNAVQNYVTFLSQMMQSPSTAAIPLKKALSLGLLHPNDYQIRNQISNQLGSYYITRDVPGVLRLVEEMNFLADVEELLVYPMPGVARETLFGFLMYQFSRVDEDRKSGLIRSLLSYPDDTFGRVMLVAAAGASSSSSSQRNAITTALEPFMDRILKMPPERQQELRFWYAQMIRQNSLPDSLKRDAPKVEAWYEPWRQAGEMNKMRVQLQNVNEEPLTPEEFLQIDRREVLDALSGLDYQALQLVPQFDQETPLAEMERFLQHYLELAGQSFPGARVSGIGATPDAVVSAWLQRNPDTVGLGKAMSLVGKFKSADEPLSPILLAAFQQGLRMIDFSQPEAVAQALAQSDQDWQGHRWTALLAERFSTMNQAQREAVERWVGRDESAMGEAWRGALALSEGDQGEAHAFWVKRLQDRALPLAHRLQSASVLAPVAVRSEAWTVMEVVVGVFEEVWETPGIEVTSGQADQVMRLLLGKGSDEDRVRDLALRFLESWTQHGEATPMGLATVREVLAADDRYGIQPAEWLPRLPQGVQREPDFFNLVIRTLPPREAAAAVPWSLVRMPPLQSQNLQSQQQIRIVNGQRQVQYVNPQQYMKGPLNLGQGRLDEALWERLEPFLEEIEDPGVRLYAEMLVVALPDDRSLEGVPSREERLQALTSRYERERFASPYLAEHMVSWLCALNEGVPEPLALEVAHYGGRIDYTPLSKWFDPRLKRSRQGLLNRFLEHAATHDGKAYAALLTLMLEQADSQSGEARQLLESYCREFPRSFLKRETLPDVEDARQYLTLTRLLTRRSYQDVYWSGRDECVANNVVMHVLASDLEGYQQWMLELDANVRREIFSRTHLDEMVFIIRDGLKSPELSQERRFEILNGLFSGGGTVEELFPSGNVRIQRQEGNVFERMVDLNLLKKAEVLQYGEGWAEANPRGGQAFGELAEFQAEAGQTEEAVLNFLQAVVHAPLTNRATYSRYHLAKTRLLLEEDRLDAAISWLEFLDRARLDEEQLEIYEALEQETRRRYLTDPERMDRVLSEIRSALQRDAGDLAAWYDFAELTLALGSQSIRGSDYLRGQAFLKLSLYVLLKLKDTDPSFEPTMLMAAQRELARSMVALGMGGRKRDLVPAQSRWNYHYQPGGLEGEAWRLPGFIPGEGWEAGRAQLGYGDNDERTVLNFGTDENNKPITAYFRTTFEVADLASLNDLVLNVMFDDGAVIYVNGAEVARVNLPPIAIEPETLAPESRGSELENTFWTTEMSGEFLRQGENVVAVEVHQNAADSSDLSFDLELASEAINTRAVIAEVESGKVFRRLKAWMESFPAGLVEQLEKW